MAPLEGLRVVDLSPVLAGSFRTMLLGDMGADVIKIEEPAKGDYMRAWERRAQLLKIVPDTQPRRTADGQDGWTIHIECEFKYAEDRSPS